MGVIMNVQMEAAGHRCTSIQGDMAHEARDRVISEFRSGATKILIATDVLARGFDVTQVCTAGSSFLYNDVPGMLALDHEAFHAPEEPLHASAHPRRLNAINPEATFNWNAGH